MSAIMPEANSVEKCPTKSLGSKEPRECLKNGLVNGLVLNNKHKMSSNHGSDNNELLTTEVIVSNHNESSPEDVVNKVGKSKRRNKKKTHKTTLGENEGVNGSKIEDISHRDNNEKVSSESLDKMENGSNSISKDGEMSPTCSQSCNVTSDINCESISSDIEKMMIKTEEIDIPQIENVIETCHKKIEFVRYESELQMPMIMKIIQKDLSEPYSIYTYRYFIHNWPKLCFLAMCEGQCVGAIVCKLDLHRKVVRRGYIAMLAVDQNYRKLKIGSTLVQMAILEMTNGDADEVVLETEVTNKPALKLYEKLGFVRDKRLFRYYLNGVDALRLKLWLR